MDVTPEEQSLPATNQVVPTPDITTASVPAATPSRRKLSIPLLSAGVFILFVVTGLLFFSWDLWISKAVSNTGTPQNKVMDLSSISTTTTQDFEFSNESVAYYADSMYGYTVYFPKGWNMTGSSTADVTVTSPTSDATIRIYVTATSDTTDAQSELDAYIPTKEAQLQKNLPSFHVLNDAPTTGYGIPGRTILGSWTTPSGEVDVTEILTLVRNGRVFEVSAIAPEKSWATNKQTFDLTFASFTFQTYMQLDTVLQQVLSSVPADTWNTAAIPAQLPGEPSFSISYPSSFGQPVISSQIGSPSAIDPENNIQSILFYAPNSPHTYPYAGDGLIMNVSALVYQLAPGQTLEDLANSTIVSTDKQKVQDSLTMNGHTVIKQMTSSKSSIIFYYMEPTPGIVLSIWLTTGVNHHNFDPKMLDRIIQSISF